jgi:hypothetical protein
MGVRKPVEVGALQFGTKGTALAYFREMLHRWPVGEQIGEPDATQLGWLLERHPGFREKAGAGVAGFSVRDAIYGYRCFEIMRLDGSKTDFSFDKCVDGKDSSAERRVVDAMRAEVAADILDAKRAFFASKGDAEARVACPLTGTRVTFGEAHADHAPPRSFGTLARLFLSARKIEPSVTLLAPHGDNQYEGRLADRALASEWRDFHHKEAAIRVVARRANLARAHEGRVKRKDAQLKLR